MNTKYIYIGIIAVLLFLLGGITGYYIKPCPSCGELISQEVHDSIVAAKDTAVKRIEIGKPKLVGIKKYKPSITNAVPDLPNQCDSSIEIACTDTTLWHTERVIPDNYKAVVNATVTGNRIIDWKLELGDLRPEHIRVVTNTILQKEKVSLVKIYAGAFGMIGQENKWGLGVKADMIIKDGYMIGYGFDAKNLSHQFELLIKIKIK